MPGKKALKTLVVVKECQEDMNVKQHNFAAFLKGND